MNILLIFFALPVAVIIISIALQKILKCPALVAAIIFAIFLIVTFVVSNLIFLVATIAYTIISYITALIVCMICRVLNNECNKRRNCSCFRFSENDNICNNIRDSNSGNELLTINSNCKNNDNGNILTISSNGCNGIENDLLTINTSCNGRRSGNSDCICGKCRRR